MFYQSKQLAFATLHIFKRRVPSIPNCYIQQHHLQSSILKLSPDESSDSKDWFSNGREVAKQLKMELGIAGKDDMKTNDTEIKDEEESSKFKVSNDILESGRAAARELIKDMMTTDEDEDDDIIQSKEDKVASEQTDIKEDYFNSSSSRKSHCYTICMVPPSSATQAWEELTAIRKQCRDPGFYRWPPHANILYPFLEPKYDNESEESKDAQRTTFRNEMAIQLSKAAERCEPFDVTIDTFGTFGGKQRGVLWAYPRSEYIQSTTTNNNDKELEPLHHLHHVLEEQFPMCKDQRKGGEFNPHMTISHYVNNDAALAAKEEIESNWKPLSFHVPEIYLLERKGDDGQFKIAATIPLGKGSNTIYHEQALPFPAMPKEEEEWVYNERMEMKNRRKRGNKRRKRRSKRSNVDTSSEGEEEQGTKT